jgi:hypothetical protein
MTLAKTFPRCYSSRTRIIILRKRFEEIDMRNKLFALIVASAPLAIVPACSAQIPFSILRAPFTAVATVTDTTPAGVKVATGIIARRSDGSTYFAINLTSNTDPKVGLGQKVAWIHDLATHKNYTLSLSRQDYQEWSTDSKAMDWTKQSATDALKQSGSVGSKYTSGEWEITVLGLRTIEGVDTVGTRQTNPNGRIIEKWFSPTLDLDLIVKNHNPSLGDREVHIEQIRLGEPDATLFKIPDGYTKAPPPKPAHSSAQSPTSTQITTPTQ